MNASASTRALAYLRSHNVMTLATNGPLGVWAAAVFYANDGFTLYFLSSPDSRHAENFAVSSTVSAAIHEDYPNWREIKGIQLEGTVTRLEGVEQALAMVRYGLKFPLVADPSRAPAEIARALGRIAWYKLVAKRLFFVDNSLGFGHRDEVPLDE